MTHSRVIAWFSCGAASAVASKLAVQEFPDAEVWYCDTGSEHPDNERFLREVESWIGKDIRILRNEKYADTWEVWEKTRYLVGPNGARCTTELKKKHRQDLTTPDDRQVFGFTIDEKKRAELFEERNPEVRPDWILIRNNLTKPDCLGILDRVGIEIPVMYRLGYENNNCIGCVKGGMGYWNKIRLDFPEHFERMAKLEREIGISILREEIPGTTKKRRVFLDELEPDRGNYKDEPDIECSLFCMMASDSMEVSESE